MNKLLVVDDNEVDLFIIDRLLKKEQLFPDRIMTTDGAGAIGLIEKNRLKPEILPDVLFLDLVMPALDGFQFLDRLNKIYATQPLDMEVYVMTCSIYKQDKERAEKYPFVKLFMVKPINLNVLSRIYAAHCGLMCAD